MFESIRGLTIILAGGSGGLGAETARLLAAEGAHLVVSYRSQKARAMELASLATLVQADLTECGDRRRLLDAAGDFYGLVVFTGDPARVTQPEEIEIAMRRSHEVNFLGPILLAREAAARMKEQQTQGAIVLISSMQAVVPFPNSTAYASQKAALIHAAKILAKECRGPANIRVNVVCPGVHQAGMAETSIRAGKYDRYLKDGVIHRFGHARDVARAIRFLLEPDHYITGQALTVDGGLTL